MRNVLAIAGREVRTYFTSPLAYVVIGVFLLLSGYIFWASLVRFSELCLRFASNPYFSSQLNVNDMVVRPLFGTMGIIFLLLLPVVTMRLLAEERRAGTAELLFTSPVTSAQVVLGKYFGAACLLLVMIGVTLTYPILISNSGAAPDMKPTFVGYLGVLLMGLALLAIGLFFSSLTDNQVVAAVSAFGAFLMLWVIDWMSSSATVTLAALMNSLSLGLWEKAGLGTGGPTLGDLLGSLSIIGHLNDFRKGLLDAQHVIFYVSVIFMALFVTQRVLESRRWR
ncbi:MAG TPA: ABC transporter permease subunit [Candidatus Polarisedimenticolia bacterium]|jgi:ABC-2 type transport system permease protein|nr:ABC transporter permease subunit [Candidatus Polarisedimenticolia bacterium]